MIAPQNIRSVKFYDALVGALILTGMLMLFTLGWVMSASTIGYECRATGLFYVGKTVYSCGVKP